MPPGAPDDVTDDGAPDSRRFVDIDAELDSTTTVDGGLYTEDYSGDLIRLRGAVALRSARPHDA